MRAVLDTNILVSALISPHGAPAAIVGAWRERKYQLVTSDALLSEVGDVLRRARTKRFTGMSDDDVAEFLADLADNAIVAKATRTIEAITSDPDDNRLLEAAEAGAADYIVTGDAVVLELGRFESAEVVTAARFAAILDSSM